MKNMNGQRHKGTISLRVAGFLAGGTLLVLLLIALAVLLADRGSTPIAPQPDARQTPAATEPTRAAPAVPGEASRPVPDLPVQKPAVQPDTADTASPQDAPTPESTPPVFLVDLESPVPAWAQVHEYIQEQRAKTASEKESLGRQLIAAETPLSRTSGALLLIEAGAFGENDLRAVASDSDQSVPLNTLGWLRDSGQGAQAGKLMAMLGELMQAEDTLLQFLNSDTLLPAGKRFVLDLVNSRLSKEAAVELYTGLASNADEAHSVRMKSALLLRNTLDFAIYREKINSLAADAQTPEWQTALQRLAAQLEGPIEVQTSPPVIGGDEIDERLARPYPSMIEDLALHIEAALAAPDSVVEKGASQILREYLADFSRTPWSLEEELGLTRLHALADVLAKRESE